jgi:ABC-type iron transport system FetAB permease component
MNEENELEKFLKNKYKECNSALKKLKKKKKITKIIYFLIILTIMSAQATVLTISTITVPPLVIPIISGIAGVLTGVSSAFKIKDLKSKIERKIDEIKKIKNSINEIELEGDTNWEKIREIVNTLI